ncbi:MAG: immunoglobulin-like domain-containing protein, partial [Marinilabilia sp.]
MHLNFTNIKVFLLGISMNLGISLTAQNISLEISDRSLDENGGEATVTATSDDIFPSDTEVVLSFSGTATFEEDYTTSDTGIIIPEGSLDGSITITSIDDNIFEGDESIIIDIESVDNGTIGSPSQVRTNIIDDESPPEVTLGASTLNIEEGETSTLTASLSTATFEDVVVSLDTNDISTNQDDYELSSNTITIEDGETSGTATFTATDDDIYESDEEVEVSISEVDGGSASFEEPQSVIITITDEQDPPEVTLSASPTTIEEDESTTLTATLSSPTSEDVTVTLATNDISTSQDDYDLSSNSITIDAGETEGTTTLSAIEDDIYEEDEEVEVAISEVDGGSASFEEPQSVTITITDEQDPPEVTLSASPTTIEEDESTTLTATLSSPTSEDVTVTLATNDISTSQDDYDLSSNSITIDAGETEGTTTLSAIEDDIYE